MSTMRSTQVLTESQHSITTPNLENYFEAAFERLEGTSSVAEYIYKKNTPDEVHINLRTKPLSAEHFYNLAVALDNGTLAEKEDSYFFAEAYSPLESNYYSTSEGLMEFAILKESLEKEIKELRKTQHEKIEPLGNEYFVYKQNKLAEIRDQITMLEQRIALEADAPMAPIKAKLAHLAQQINLEKQNRKLHEGFIVNLLLDAAQAGYQPALGFLVQLTADLDYSNFLQPINQLLKNCGYSLIRNQDNKTYLNLWSKQRAPRSIAELEKLAADLEIEGPQGSYYFLVNPKGINTLRETLLKTAAEQREKGSYWIETQLISLRTLARAGQYEEAKKLTKTLLETGREVYNQKAHLDRLDQVTEDLLKLALSPKISTEETTTKETVLKATGHHTQALKQPQLAAGITPGMLSANSSTLLHTRPQPSTGNRAPTYIVTTGSRPHTFIISDLDDEDEQPNLTAPTTTLSFS